MVENKLHLMK